MPAPTQNVSEVLTTGLSLPTRSLLISEEITGATVRLVWTAIQALDDGTDFTIYLNSPGGYLQSSFAIYDMIRACRSWVTIVGTGQVSSGATLILQAADIRLLTPNTTVMFHPAYLEGGIGADSHEEIGTILDDARKNNERMLSILAKRMRLTLKRHKALYPKTVYFSALEAVAAQLADSIYT